MEKNLKKKEEKINKLVESISINERAEILKIDKEVKFTIAQLGSKRRRDLKKVGPGIFESNDSKGKEIMVLV